MDNGLAYLITGNVLQIQTAFGWTRQYPKCQNLKFLRNINENPIEIQCRR